MGVGEALVSFLDEKGTPGVVERAMVVPPHSQIGPITPEQRAGIIAASADLDKAYGTAIDRESAYERLKGKAVASTADVAAPPAEKVPLPIPGQAPAAAASGGGWMQEAMGVGGSVLGGLMGSGTGRRMTPVQAMVQSAARTMGSTVGRQLIRGVLGSLMGGGKR